MLFNEMKTCTIEHSSLNKNFKVNVDGGSGSYEYSWNDNEFVSVNSFSRSEVLLQNNQLSIKVIVKDISESENYEIATDCDNNINKLFFKILKLANSDATTNKHLFFNFTS